MGRRYLPWLCPLDLDSAGAEISLGRAAAKKTALHCLPEDMPRWTFSFVKQLAYVKAALSLYNGYTSKHLLLWQNIAVLKVFHQNEVTAVELYGGVQTWFKSRCYLLG